MTKKFISWKSLQVASWNCYLQQADKNELRDHSITTWTRWGGKGSKNVCFVHAQGISTVYTGGGGSEKIAKFCPRSCWMTPWPYEAESLLKIELVVGALPEGKLWVQILQCCPLCIQADPVWIHDNDLLSNWQLLFHHVHRTQQNKPIRDHLPGTKMQYT